MELVAMICSFECTFCASCASVRLLGACPSCGRPAAKLGKFPASTERVCRPNGCGALA
jgi:hypothetical protein